MDEEVALVVESKEEEVGRISHLSFVFILRVPALCSCSDSTHLTFDSTLKSKHRVLLLSSTSKELICSANRKTKQERQKR
jgi:hypothetical protein